MAEKGTLPCSESWEIMLPKLDSQVMVEHDAERGGEYTGLGRFVLAFSQIPKSAGAQGPHVKWYSVSI